MTSTLKSLRALSDPTRLRIVSLLEKDELSVNELQEVARLGQSGQDCYDAIVKMDAKALGASFNLNMKCWETLLPHVVRHPLIRLDLMALLKAYQRQYPGAMYSGCGGGYLIVASNQPVPGAFKVNVRVAQK